MRFGAVCLFACVAAGTVAGFGNAPAKAAVDCPGNPEALGTSRILVVDPAEHTRLGTMQYRETLPLADKEVVLTFDDGPLPPYSNRVLDILASECVKATYFLVGKMARAYPAGAKAMLAAGHTIGTHSNSHPLTFHKMPLAMAEQEINDGIANIAAALGAPDKVAPFFRIPGLLRADQVETYLASRTIMTWSADFPADDWKKISAAEIIQRAISRLEAKGKGMLLLHDIQPATVLALPTLLKELKARGFKIVHVVPAAADRPATPTVAAQWFMRPPKVQAASIWPAGPIPMPEIGRAHLAAPAPQTVGFDASHDATLARPLADAPAPGKILARHLSRWPRRTPAPSIIDLVAREELPVPSPDSFLYSSTLKRYAATSERRVMAPIAPPPAISRNAGASAPTDITGRWPVTTASMPKAAFP